MLLERALASLDEQTFRDFETIVVDDASTDDTVVVLKSRPSATLIQSSHRIGGAAARNLGIGAARGEYVAFLDSDDEWLPRKLAAQVDLLDADAQLGAVYCRFIGKDDRTGLSHLSRGDLYRGWIRSILLSGRCPHTTSLFLVRKAALRSCDGFDAALLGFQDADLWIRLAETWKFDFVDEPLAIVHAHEGERVTTNFEERAKALDQFLAKWGNEMERSLGRSGLKRFKAERLGVAQGYRVLARVESGNRTAAIGELAEYLRIAGLRRPKQLAGLFAAVTLGPGYHTKIKAALGSG
jgi:glycosyltransferase involved in cell wall biosynthesis